METILLLEGISDHAEMMRAHLEKQNYKVMISPSTIQAREILEKQLPDLLVIDLNVADDEFYTFYSWLTATAQTSQVPRLFIAGKMQQEIALKLESEQKETILTKPLDLNRFISTIDRLKQGDSPVLRKNRKQDYFESLIGKKIGKTTILKEIGRGGMGAVFLGRQDNLERNVAVKLLLPELADNEAALERFQREALAIARLKSPHIVQIYDFGQLDTHAFHITMEYIPGNTLEHILRHKGRFPLAKALSVIMQTAVGLTAAHDAGLIHRDIKPSNLMIDNKGHVTITDFGLVRPNLKSRQTQTGMIVGTPHYLPPEQTTDSPLDARSDIYSLGIVFYHLIVGHPPFLSNNPMEILMKHLSEPLPDPRKIVPSIPTEVVEVIERMTAKDPAERYINCRELLWDLKSRDIDDSMDGSYARKEKTARPAAGPAEKLLVDTSVFQGHEELKKQFPALFTHDNILGAMALTRSGTLLSTQGKFPETWKNFLYILQESTLELNAAVQLGHWRFKITETPEEVLALFPDGKNLGSLLVTRKDTNTLSSTNFNSGTGSFVNVTHSTDPVGQIAGIAGVTDVMLFDQSGKLRDSRLKNPKMLETYTLRIAPVSQIIQSIPIRILSVDLWFDKGRVLIWMLEKGIIFIVAESGVSRSFLSIYITAFLEQLNNNTASADPPKLTTEPEAITVGIAQEVTDPIPVALMEGLQLELARVIGPIAKILVSKECKKLGYSRGLFPFAKLDALVKQLAAKVESTKQPLFTEKVQDLIYDFKKS